MLRTLKSAGFKAYLVGGLVRDRLRGKPGGDFDVATNARAEQVQKLFRKVIPTGIQHGTVTVLTKNDKVEVTTFRGEGAYADGRRPDSVVFLDDVKEDLARRDFTMNAMAFDPLGQEFVDPFGGARDLEARIIRCVGKARDRFSEDGLRPLRAVRFASILGFDIDPETREAIPATLSTFNKIALERVREELSKMVVGPQPSRGVRLLHETGLLQAILPEAAQGDFERTLARLDACPPRLEVRHAALLFAISPEQAQAAMERLRHPRAVIDRTAALVRFESYALKAYADDAGLRQALSPVGRVFIEDVLALGAAEARASGDASLRATCEETSRRTQAVLDARPALTVGELALNGKAVMAILGGGQGPLVGEALRYLLGEVLRDPAANVPATLENLLQKWRLERGSAAGPVK
ncbi:MAG TPA: CCA tRNA nucleotidyltransferase [Myxococcales bacterium]